MCKRSTLYKTFPSQRHDISDNFCTTTNMAAHKIDLAPAEAVQKLFNAVEEGDPKLVILCLRKITEQAFFNLGPTLLQKAALLGHYRILKLFLDLKLDLSSAHVDCRNAQLLTSLHIVCTEGHTECATFLLSRGADVNAVDFDNRTPLYFAAHNGHIECIEELLKYSADVNLARYGGWTPLHEAARFGYLDCVKKLIEFEANFSVTSDDASWTPGHLAASNGKLDCLRYLIQCGIDIEAQGGPYHASTLLHEAAHMGHSECIILLLESGANEFALNGHGELALHLATRQGHEKSLEILLQQYNKVGRCDVVNAFPEEHETSENVRISRSNALHSASFHGHKRCVEILLRNGALHLMNGAELYPIHIAAKQKHVGCLRTMLAHGDDGLLSQLSGNDYNALQYLSMTTHAFDKKAMACACVMVNAGIDFDATPEFDDRLCSLYLAARNGAYELVHYLLISGAKTDVEVNFNERILTNPRVAQSAHIIKCYQSEPLPLFIASRIAIRKYLYAGGLANTFVLPLPEVLQHYIYHGHANTDGLCDL